MNVSRTRRGLGFGLALAALAVPAGTGALSITPTSMVIVDYTIAANGSAQFPNTMLARSARKGLSVSPTAVVLAPGNAATVQVQARAGRSVVPGD